MPKSLSENIPPYYASNPDDPASPSSGKPLLSDIDTPLSSSPAPPPPHQLHSGFSPTPSVSVRPYQSNMPLQPLSQHQQPQQHHHQQQSSQQSYQHPDQHTIINQQQPEPTGRPGFWPSSGWTPAYSPGVGQSLPGQNKSRAAPTVVSSCNVIPVPLLGRWPAMVHCPACDNLGLTGVRYSIGMGTHALAACLLFTTGIGVVLPYIAPQCKDVEHKCSGCESVLATHWFLGGTEAHMF